MEFIKVTDQNEGLKMCGEAMGREIAKTLLGGKPVLWLICGGSCIPAAAFASRLIHAEVSDLEKLSMLTVALTDERYVAVGHKDSNWAGLIAAGFDFSGCQTVPILSGDDLDTTVLNYEKSITENFAEIAKADGLILALFGIGPDSHIAGMIPNSPAVKEEKHAVVGYDAHLFTRVTLTMPMLRKINVAYAATFGESKRAAVEKLRSHTVPLIEEPCQILKEIPRATLYTDV